MPIISLCRQQADLIRSTGRTGRNVWRLLQWEQHIWQELRSDTGKTKKMSSRTGQWIIHLQPAITEEERKKRLKGWNKAVRYAFDWARDEE